jgi:hypothetical protein
MSIPQQSTYLFYLRLPPPPAGLEINIVTMKQQIYPNVLLGNRNRVDISIHVPKSCKKNESNSFKLFVRKTLFLRFRS